jgi:integrase
MPATKPCLFLRRGRVWTIVYPGPDGRPRQQATKYRGPEQERSARKALALFTQRLEAGARLDGGTDGPLTVARWASQWVEGRAAKDVRVDEYRSRLERHILPHIGHLRLDKVTPEHVGLVLAAVRKTLAPRTQRHVYWTMHAMFRKAVPRLLEVNPCSLDDEDLPRKKDADPEWRATAIFTRAEVELLLTDERIPHDRRTVYAIIFLAGLRFGEASALCVRHYRPELEPLGQLQVARSFDSRRRRLKDTKTERPRNVPVHPWLAELLGDWLERGWPAMMGRAPTADDVLVPTRRGTHRNSSTGWAQLNGERDKTGRTLQVGDIERLGLRQRRQHDARRTFISFARADGARKDLLRLITHGPEGDIVDVYTEMPWAPLCEQVAVLRLGPGCHRVAMEENMHVINGLGSDPSGIRKFGHADDTAGRSVAAGAKSHKIRGPRKGPAATPTATGGQPGPVATLATLALRQALAALDRGRLDQVREILERAIEQEVDTAEAVS